jgi:YegS/Rv2252/BmrU family lipid kinase
MPQIDDTARPLADHRLAPPGTTVRAMLIINPQAGPGLWPGAQPAADRLIEAGWQVDIARTEYAGHASALAASAVAQHYHVVIGGGGDGTLNEIIQALIGSQTALGIIPLGTANVLARDLGVPLDPVGAATTLIEGQVSLIDVGRANRRAFVMMAGICLDADVVREVQEARPRPPRWLKAPLLLIGTVHRFFTYPGTPMQLTIDGQPERGRVLMVVVGNIQSYAGVFFIAHEADWSDGVFDIVIFYQTRLIDRVTNFISMLFRRHKERPGVGYRRARRLHISTPQPIPVQADGDIVGETPMIFTIEPAALRIVRP